MELLIWVLLFLSSASVIIGDVALDESLRGRSDVAVPIQFVDTINITSEFSIFGFFSTSGLGMDVSILAVAVAHCSARS